MTVFIVLYFVKRFVWDHSVFTQYSYYCDFFCSGPAPRLRDCHSHKWVRYIDTTKIINWCISLLILSIDLQWLYYFIMSQFKLSQNFFSSQVSNLFICGIFWHNFFAAEKGIHNLQSLIINNKYSNQVSVIKPSNQW